mgnify:CR=1 FL=1
MLKQASRNRYGVSALLVGSALVNFPSTHEGGLEDIFGVRLAPGLLPGEKHQAGAVAVQPVAPFL